MQVTQPFVKDIVLIGGGHAHALMIRKWAMQPTPGIRLTLISPNIYTPYSGMLPGLIAEHYQFSETHIDLMQLCAWANVRFIQDEVTNINGKQQFIEFNTRPNLEYDICSIDIGSTPNQSIEGSAEFAIGVKPIAQFYTQWQTLQQKILAHRDQQAPIKVVIIGAGAGGIELITAMNFWATKHNCNASFHLVNRGNQLIPHASSALQTKLNAHFKKSQIQCTHDFDTQKIDAQFIYSESQKIPYDQLFYCTQAAPAGWLRRTDIALNQQGFITVNRHLQSVSHDNIFAAGDVAHFIESPIPKAGVYAVRMAPILLNNVINLCVGKPLVSYHPQKNFLSLLALGEQYALGQKGQISIWGKWAWRLKNHIDKTFMNLFHELPAMCAAKTRPLPTQLQSQLLSEDALALTPRCGGCGGKVAATVIQDIIKQLKPYEQTSIISGISAADDGAIIRVPPNSHLVQSLDHLKSCSTDPYLFGKISALHALSDLFAMHAKPHSALTLLQLPNASGAIQRRDMHQLMQGAVDVLNTHNCSLIGGHTSESSELQLGFCVNGLTPQTQPTIPTDLSGHAIIVSKGLGTGVILAAHMQANSKGEFVQGALDSMLVSNAHAAQIFQSHQSSYLTDVTGFGLVGHLLTLLKKHALQTYNTPASAQLTLDNIPALKGALALFNMGIRSTLHGKNQRAQESIQDFHSQVTHPHYPLLFDPQTSGGLLGIVPLATSDACLLALQQAGLKDSAIIGYIGKPTGPHLISLITRNS